MIDCTLAHLWPSGQVLLLQLTACMSVVLVAKGLFVQVVLWRTE